MRRYRAFADNHPRVWAAAQVDDGRGGGSRRWAAVDDEWDLVAELLQHGLGVSAFRCAAEVGGSCGDGQAEASDDCAGDGGFGDAESEVASVSRDSQRKLASGFDDDGERAGPEFFGKAIKGSVELASEFVGLCYFGDEERERFVAGTGFELIDAIDGAEIDGVDGETVEGVGGERDDVAAIETGDDTVDEGGFGFVGMNAEGFGRQVLAPVGRVTHPILFTQSLRTKQVSFVLRNVSKIISGQSLQSKAVDLCSTRTFFVPDIDSNR